MYGPIFEARNRGVAIRNYFNLLRKVAEWDRDAYELVQVGFWDAENGVLVPAKEVVDVNIPRFEDVKQRKFEFEEEANAK